MLGGMRVEEIADELAVLVAGLEPGCYAGPDAARLACCFERIERLSAGAKTLLARRAAECGEWSKAGARTPAGWLAGLWGVPQGAAHAALSLAEAASVNPSLDQAMRRGELSPAQAGEVAAAAGADPSSTERMIAEARTVGFKALREQRLAVQNTARSAEDDAERAQRQHRSRYVRLWADVEGCGHLEGRPAPAAFACFKAYLAPFEREAFQTARAERRWESFDTYRADALLAMAEASCQAQHTTTPGDTAPGAGDTTPGAGDAIPGAGDGRLFHPDTPTPSKEQMSGVATGRRVRRGPVEVGGVIDYQGPV